MGSFHLAKRVEVRARQSQGDLALFECPAIVQEMILLFSAAGIKVPGCNGFIREQGMSQISKNNTNLLTCIAHSLSHSEVICSHVPHPYILHITVPS